jgi:uncharacterized protein (DUF924 family)
VLSKWFGVGKTLEEKGEFDVECLENFGPALKALAPEKLELPTFESYEKDLENAETISAPLFAEVKDAQAQDTKKGTDTLLSLILLLDQMPRNIFRDPKSLPLVFRHYDRISWSLLYSSLRLDPNPINHPSIQKRVVFQFWFLMPLMHSEHLASHELFMSIITKWRKEIEGDKASEGFMDNNIEFEGKHQEPLKLFGRYPHRNAALGRNSTKEEEAYVKEAGSFGVQQSTDDKKKEGKSEL